MKTLLIFSMIFTLISCGEGKVLEIKGESKTIETYGWLQAEKINECVNYEYITGNIIGSIILVETIFLPIFITGFELFEPISVKIECIKQKKDF